MKKIVLFICIIFFVSFCLAQNIEYYALTINYQNGDLIISKVVITEGLDVNYFDEGKYTLKVISFLDEILFETKFDFNPEVSFAPLPSWFDEEGNQIVIPDTSPPEVNVSKILFVPYFLNGARIEVSEGASLIDSFDISKFAVCNENDICENEESFDICPNDCEEQQEGLENGEAKQLGEKIKAKQLIEIAIFVLIIVVVIFLFLKFRKKQ